MIVLDTNVLSEPLRANPDARLVRWLDAQHIETLYVTSLTVAEIRTGIAFLPDGERKRALSRRFEQETFPLFSGRVLAFDDAASLAFARIQSAARVSGRTLPTTDALIAAICAANGFALATRNVRDFATTGLTLIDPWTTATE